MWRIQEYEEFCSQLAELESNGRRPFTYFEGGQLIFGASLYTNNQEFLALLSTLPFGRGGLTLPAPRSHDPLPSLAEAQAVSLALRQAQLLFHPNRPAVIKFKATLSAGKQFFFIRI